MCADIRSNEKTHGTLAFHVNWTCPRAGSRSGLPTELDLASFVEAIGEFGDIVWEIDQLSQVPEPGSCWILIGTLMCIGEWQTVCLRRLLLQPGAFVVRAPLWHEVQVAGN